MIFLQKFYTYLAGGVGSQRGSKVMLSLSFICLSCKKKYYQYC